MSREQIKQTAKYLYLDGYTMWEIAKKCECSVAFISLILRGKR